MPQLVVELEACHVELGHLLVSAADEADVEATCAAVQELLQTGDAAIRTSFCISVVLTRPFHEFVFQDVQENAQYWRLSVTILNNMG